MRIQQYIMVQDPTVHIEKRSFGASRQAGLLDWLRSHCNQTAPGFKWNTAERTSPGRYQLSCFVSHQSAIVV